ncbi:MAG: hypothetical protein QME96_17445, partial [Myxococcota bacterium]|nr:hypothetical protein [Myxococcota bacterium]
MHAPGVGDILFDRSQDAAPIAERVWEKQDERLRTGRTLYLPTGWPEWDDSEDWQGWSSEGVTYVLARSGMGKTSFLNSTA